MTEPGSIDGGPATRRPAPIEVGPVPLAGGDLVLRHPRYDDFPAWREVRLRNQQAIQRFWPTTTESWEELHTEWHWLQQVADHRDAARAGSGVAFVIQVAGHLAGQVNLTGIDPVERSAELGIWTDRRRARRHVTVATACVVLDVALTRLGLRRITAPSDVRNRPALALAHHLGMTREATMRGFSHVDGAWRDHHLMAIRAEDRPAEGFLATHLDVALPDSAALVRPGRPLDVWPAGWRGRSDLARHRLRGVRSRWTGRVRPGAAPDEVPRLGLDGHDLARGVRAHDRAHGIAEVYVDDPVSPDEARDAIRRATAYALGELGAHRVTATAAPDDGLRATAYAAAGLRHEGTLRSRLLPDGTRGEEDLWAVLADDPRP